MSGVFEASQPQPGDFHYENAVTGLGSRHIRVEDEYQRTGDFLHHTSDLCPFNPAEDAKRRKPAAKRPANIIQQGKEREEMEASREAARDAAQAAKRERLAWTAHCNPITGKAEGQASEKVFKGRKHYEPDEKRRMEEMLAKEAKAEKAREARKNLLARSGAVEGDGSFGNVLGTSNGRKGSIVGSTGEGPGSENATTSNKTAFAKKRNASSIVLADASTITVPQVPDRVPSRFAGRAVQSPSPLTNDPDWAVNDKSTPITLKPTESPEPSRAQSRLAVEPTVVSRPPSGRAIAPASPSTRPPSGRTQTTGRLQPQQSARAPAKTAVPSLNLSGAPQPAPKAAVSQPRRTTEYKPSVTRTVASSRS